MRRLVLDERGMTVAEVLIAVVIIGVGLVALSSAIPLAAYGIQEGNQLSTATFLANQRLEQIRNAAWQAARPAPAVPAVAAVDKLGVAEVLVTYGLRGSHVYANGRAEWVGASPVAADPTGSGDAFSAAYLAGRSQGLAPVSAARLATGIVGAMLTRRLP